MKRLAIDTSTPRHSIALSVRGTVVAERATLRRGGQTRLLSRTIDEILSEAELQVRDLDELVCGIGPGSFTGLRVGLAFVKGALSAVDVPFRAISTFDSYVAAFEPGTTVAVALDARKGQVFATIRRADTENHDTLLPPSALTPEAFVEAARSLLPTNSAFPLAGNAHLVFPTLIQGAPSPFVAQPGLTHPEARWLIHAAELGYGDTLPAASAEPLYVRPSDAELNGPRVAQRRAEPGRS